MEELQSNEERECSLMKYTLEQIIKCWREVYGEDMETEYAGFIKELQKEDK